LFDTGDWTIIQIVRKEVIVDSGDTYFFYEMCRHRIIKLISLIAVIVMMAVVTLASQSCILVPSNELNTSFSIGLVTGSDHVYYVDSYGRPIVLLKNKDARDPSYRELVNFLNLDNTDRFPYIQTAADIDSSTIYGDPRRLVDHDFWLQVAEGKADQYSPRICADFAEVLYNNAELNGIRAGYVSITLSSSSIGHAINVFNTTDRGLVFIDDTGEELDIHVTDPGSVTFGVTSDCDKVAYLEKGKPYGVVSLNVADQYGFDYSGFEKWLSAKEEFSELSSQYDSLIAGRSILPRNDYYRLQDILSRMKELAGRLGGFWEGLDGVVTGYTITWDGQW
jgi:hypothetical protein